MKPADDENGYIRELTRTLRGRHAVIRPKGEAFDRLANDAASEGYPVTEFSFVEALFQDALAWANRSPVRGRIYPATWQGLTDQDDGAAYGEAYAEYLRSQGIDPESTPEEETQCDTKTTMPAPTVISPSGSNTLADAESTETDAAPNTPNGASTATARQASTGAPSPRAPRLSLASFDFDFAPVWFLLDRDNDFAHVTFDAGAREPELADPDLAWYLDAA